MLKFIYLAFDFKKLQNIKFTVIHNEKEIILSNRNLKFKDLGLNKHLLSNIDKINFSTMTPIQSYVIPLIISGKDLIGCSQTGSGKTMAFLTPIIDNMLLTGPPDDYEQLKCSMPMLLILIPTRELAEQIYKEAKKLTYMTGINVVKLYGGVPYNNQIIELKEGCDIIITTPGRLIDFLQKELIKLNQVKYFVIDEADKLMDMGFEKQLNKIIYEFGIFILIRYA